MKAFFYIKLMRASSQSEEEKINSHIYNKIDFPLKENFQLRKNMLYYFFAITKIKLDILFFCSCIVKKKLSQNWTE